MKRPAAHSTRGTLSPLKTGACAFSALIVGCFAIKQIAAASILESFSRSSQKQVMMPLRRLGLLPVAQNIVDARKVLTDQTTLKGILAQPLSHDEFALKINTQLKATADASGRFWTMDAISQEVVAGRSATGAEMSNFQRAQLVREYDLDGWLKTEVYFTADHTSVRFALLDPQGRQVIAREDVLLPFGVDWDSLANAFAQALGRMSDTIGHDGRVVFENTDLVGIDFGVERGLAPGHRLKAGLVLKDSAHPQTGEVLRYQRTALLELEVVEAKQGAALCRKIVFDPELLKQAEIYYGTGPEKRVPLLVWREEFNRADPAWQQGRNSVRVDASARGFPRRESVADSGSARASSLSSAPSGADESGAEKQAEVITPNPQMAMSGGGAAFSRPKFSSRTSSGPGSAIEIGAGVTEGTLVLSKGPVTSALPAAIVNQFWIKDGFNLNPEWDVFYGGEYVMFSDTLEGSRLTGRAGLMAAEEVRSVPELPIRWGAEGQVSSGEVKTSRSRKTFDAFELAGVISTRRSFDGGWGLEGEVKPSVTGLLAGAFGYEFAVNVHPGIAPKGLGVQWKLYDDGDHWSEWSLGVIWKLGAGE